MDNYRELHIGIVEYAMGHFFLLKASHRLKYIHTHIFINTFSGKGLASFVGCQLVYGFISFPKLFSYTFYFTTACGIPVLLVYHLVVKRRYEDTLIREKKELLGRVRGENDEYLFSELSLVHFTIWFWWYIYYWITPHIIKTRVCQLCQCLIAPIPKSECTYVHWWRKQQQWKQIEHYIQLAIHVYYSLALQRTYRMSQKCKICRALNACNSQSLCIRCLNFTGKNLGPKFWYLWGTQKSHNLVLYVPPPKKDPFPLTRSARGEWIKGGHIINI